MGPKAIVKKPVTKKAAPKVKPSHPTYQIMISHAIAELKERTGSSQPAIIKYIEANYNVSPDTFKTQLKMAFKRLLEKGILEKIKASYKLSEAGRTEHKQEAGIKSAPKPKADVVVAPPKPVSKKAPAKPTASASRSGASKKNAAKPHTSTVVKKPIGAPKKGTAKKPAASTNKKAAAKK